MLLEVIFCLQLDNLKNLPSANTEIDIVFTSQNLTQKYSAFGWGRLATHYAVSFVLVDKEAVTNLIRWTKSIILCSSSTSFAAESGASGKYVKRREAVLKSRYEIIKLRSLLRC